MSAQAECPTCTTAEQEHKLVSSAEWWAHTKAYPARILAWLKSQYHGERMAATRMVQFADCFRTDMTEAQHKIISIIADQEQSHADWIAGLLSARGAAPQLLNKTERYWEKTLPGVHSFDTGAAMAAHAEEMRLERIRAICEDPAAPADIRSVFARILPQEEFHARAFRRMTSDAAYTETAGRHSLGRLALGLVA